MRINKLFLLPAIHLLNVEDILTLTHMKSPQEKHNLQHITCHMLRAWETRYEIGIFRFACEHLLCVVRIHWHRFKPTWVFVRSFNSQTAWKYCRHMRDERCQLRNFTAINITLHSNRKQIVIKIRNVIKRDTIPISKTSLAYSCIEEMNMRARYQGLRRPNRQPQRNTTQQTIQKIHKIYIWVHVCQIWEKVLHAKWEHSPPDVNRKSYGKFHL